eukprot:31089-Chlamydomonas_euryale.AAC.5
MAACGASPPSPAAGCARFKVTRRALRGKRSWVGARAADAGDRLGRGRVRLCTARCGRTRHARTGPYASTCMMKLAVA